jgi:hypothetical protein
MGRVLHGSACTTEAIRRAIQHSQESLRALAGRWGINQRTVAKWKRRTSVADLPTGPQGPRSTVLSVEDEAVIVAFRRHTLWPVAACTSAARRSTASRSSVVAGVTWAESRWPTCQGPCAAWSPSCAWPRHSRRETRSRAWSAVRLSTRRPRAVLLGPEQHAAPPEDRPPKPQSSPHEADAAPVGERPPKAAGRWASSATARRS